MIEPYYKDPDCDITIYCGDCLEVMKQIPDKSVDLVLTDPPYGIDYSRHISNGIHSKIANDTTLNWLDNTLNNTNTLLKDNGSLYMFCSWHNVEVFKIAINKFFEIRNMLIWNKQGNGMGDLTTTYGSIYEICFYANRSPQLLNGNRNCDMLTFSRSGNELHPTQKPIDLIKFLISKSSNETDLIMDCFLGSGTTAVACKQLNRRCIGIEISQKYCDIAVQRLKATPMSLFK